MIKISNDLVKYSNYQTNLQFLIIGITSIKWLICHITFIETIYND